MPKKKTNGESGKASKAEAKGSHSLSLEERVEIQASNDNIARLKADAAELRMAYLEREATLHQQIQVATQMQQERLAALAKRCDVDFLNGKWEYHPKTGKFVQK